MISASLGGALLPALRVEAYSMGRRRSVCNVLWGVLGEPIWVPGQTSGVVDARRARGGGGVLQAADSRAGISCGVEWGTARSLGRGSSGRTATAVVADGLGGGWGVEAAGGPAGGLMAVLWRIRSARWYCSRSCRATSTDRWWTLQQNRIKHYSTPEK